ncbi:hypothetical protein LZZ85_22480 [Terrimonas sp. NA20]|uniref:LVIVD repeat-containing protein n=1 Tax=Terrimonas ginsenosidimutans TaxID=2908004 RepID=A0ABS9KXN6_9BACT|nr:hypothetical protein [Terrimonas ginsenosidimutans]MCG2617080.1 hypothetical protein [Terrimonas ginsenosidimutans]
MKPITRLLLPLLPVFLLAGCLKDKVTRTYTIFTPVYKEKSVVLADVVKPLAGRSVQNAGKIYVYGNYLFVNEINEGVHIIDNSNPEAPVSKSFINIPGNVDIAVKGNILYADIYSDMIALDISNPLQAKVTKLTSNLFPERNYIGSNGWYFTPDTSRYIVGWTRKDTTVAYESPEICTRCGIVFDNFATFANASSSGATVGIAGSMARFAIVNNYMYAVGLYSLKVIDVATPSTPSYKKDISIGSGIETIFPFKDKLFIGSNRAMYIYDISVAETPKYTGSFPHVRSCDPVVTDGVHAYVTLRAGNFCGDITESRLEILDVANLAAPKLVKTYPMKNPYGLAKDGNLLWICDGTAGLKLYDVSNPADISLKKSISNIEPFDVIPMNGKLIVSAKEGILQYDYSNLSDIRLLSRIQKK